MVISSPKHKIPTRTYTVIVRLHMSLARMYFVKIWLFYCVLLSGMLYVYESDVSVAIFET